MIKQRIFAYAKLMRLHRPIGIYLLMWPTLWALWIAAQGMPDWKILMIFLLGTVIMRSAGCVINDIADRNFDGHVARTKQRPLVTGEISLKQAMMCFFILCLLALVLVLQLNWLTIQLSLLGLLLAIVYPFCKRITYWPQLILGAAFSWAIPMAFAAQTGHVPLLAWGLLVIGILWPLAYDTMYAMTDREDDIAIGIKSTAILFGKNDVVIIALIQFCVLAGLLMIGVALAFKAYFYFTLVIACLFVVYQITLIKTRRPEKCFRAFLNNHWIGACVFAGIFFSYGIH